MQWVYEVKVSSYAGHLSPSVLLAKRASLVHVFQEGQMLVLYDKWQFKVAFTLTNINHSWEFLCFASSQEKLRLKSLVGT